MVSFAMRVLGAVAVKAAVEVLLKQADVIIAFGTAVTTELVVWVALVAVAKVAVKVMFGLEVAMPV